MMARDAEAGDPGCQYGFFSVPRRPRSSDPAGSWSSSSAPGPTPRAGSRPPGAARPRWRDTAGTARRAFREQQRAQGVEPAAALISGNQHLKGVVCRDPRPSRAPVGVRSRRQVNDLPLSCLFEDVQWPPSRLGRPGVNQVRMPAHVQIHGEQVVTQPVPPARTRRLLRDPDRASEADEEAAYSAFFRAHFARVTRTIYLIVHDDGRAEDLTQEAFLQLLRNWSRVSGYERPDAWVRRIAIRLAVRSLRRDELWRSVRELFVPQERPSGRDLDVAQAIGQLPRGQRAAIVLYYYEDQPVAEIASVLGCSESTVRVHLYRGRQRLAHLLGEEDADASRP